MSGPLVLGERGREAGCCARLAAGTEELFIVEFWWFKSYGIAWNHCRSLEALQNCKNKSSLSLSLSLFSPPSLPPALPCYNFFQTSFLFSFPFTQSQFFWLFLSQLSHSFCLSSLSVLVHAVPYFLLPAHSLIPVGMKFAHPSYVRTVDKLFSELRDCFQSWCEVNYVCGIHEESQLKPLIVSSCLCHSETLSLMFNVVNLLVKNN